MSSKYSLINEWLGSSFGRLLNINTQAPQWIVLEKDVEVDDVYIEVRELVGKSIGINIGFDYHACANELKVDEINSLAQKTRNDIFLFDIMMINVDRTPTNINLMKVENEVFSIDYESSLLFQEILENKNLLEDVRVLQGLRNNPLYQEIEEEEIAAFVEKIKTIPLNEVISEIPLELLSKEERTLFLNGVESRADKEWFLKETMFRLKQIKIESPEELKTRRNKNHEDFLRKFKENLK